MPPFRLVVFDLDGTLVDSRRDLADAANAVLVECGAEPLTRGAHRPHGRRRRGDARRARVRSVQGRCSLPDALRRFLEIYNSHLLRSTRAISGCARGARRRLLQRSALAVLTNKPIVPTRAILAGLDLARYFPRGLGARRRRSAATQAGSRGASASDGDRARSRPDETLMVGDSIVDWRTARAAAAHACVARYGFGFQTFRTRRARRRRFGGRRADRIYWLCNKSVRLNSRSCRATMHRRSLPDRIPLQIAWHCHCCEMLVLRVRASACDCP